LRNWLQKYSEDARQLPSWSPNERKGSKRGRCRGEYEAFLPRYKCVFISRWKLDDAYYSEAKIISSSLQKGEISAYTSVLTLLDTTSVAGKLYADRMKDKGSEQKKMFIIKAIRRLAVMRIRFIHLVRDIPLRLGNVKVDMPTLLADSIFLSFLTALRPLT
jgi:hypothetical protein